MRRWLPIAMALLCLATGRSSAEVFADRAKAVVKLGKSSARRGETVVWQLSMNINAPFHTYPAQQPPDAEDQNAVISLRRPSSGPFVFVGEVISPAGHWGVTSEGKRAKLVDGTAQWEWRFVVHPEAKPGKYNVKLRGNLQVCDERSCLNSDPPEAEFEILDEPTVEVDPKYRAEVASFSLSGSRIAPPVPAGPAVTLESKEGPEIVAPVATLEEYEADLKAVREQIEPFTKPTVRPASGLLGFLGAAMFWGAVALITPCVFPMIPITVSFFLHQSEKEHHRPLKMALIYCGTIILVLGISALTLLTFFRALSIHPATNIALGGLFLFFALSLFGMYEITLPSRLTSFTSTREGKGGIVGTVFMALTFTIVSFTCVAPFLGGFGGMASGGQFRTWELILGAFVFSTTFASPFFVLALFPSLIKKLPQSGSWLNSVKVVMGFLELAAALKFFRTAELRILDSTQYFTYDLVLGIWVALALIVGLYLLNMFRLHHDEPIEHIGVVRMLLGLAFIGLAIYLLPAIFKNGKSDNQRPRGVAYAWIDSFLLPEPSQEEMPWSANLKGTIDAARKELEKSGKQQFVFIDFTGVTCTNCKYNEGTVFSRPDVRELLLKFRLVQLYTDEVPAGFYPNDVDDDRRYDEAKPLNLTFQREVFGTEQLPLYVALEVLKDKVVVRGIYDEGKINEAGAFVKFLRKALKDDKKDAAK